jgi:hypothetical protein
VIKLKCQAHTQAAFIQISAHYNYFITTEPDLDQEVLSLGKNQLLGL